VQPTIRLTSDTGFDESETVNRFEGIPATRATNIWINPQNVPDGTYTATLEWGGAGDPTDTLGTFVTSK
jgi:hypothetical protein